MPTSSVPSETLLVFSDVHLGSDLNDNGPINPRSAAIDDDLAALIAHYARIAPAADRWHMVIAGDFIDFVGMAIDPREGDAIATEPTAAERDFGLGGAEDHVRLKLRRAAMRHPAVFAELGRFVAAGHALTLIHGNHDLELHWDSVKGDFCELLASASEHADARAAIAQRVAFSPWFFHREGLVFIEHGHQYDPFCAVPHVLAPLSPTDPSRVSQSLSDTLLRYIVRRTPGMKEYGHEDRGLTSYISWGLMLGLRGATALFGRFFRVIRHLTTTARAYASEKGAQIRAEHERRLRELARATALSEQTLRSALALHCRPMGATPRGVLASVMLDRLGLFLAMGAVLAMVGLEWSRLGPLALPLLGGLVVLWVVLHVIVSRGRPAVDPGAVMISRAGELARLFPSSFVVMGHTHVPATKPMGAGYYVNLGSWAEEEPAADVDRAKVYRAARTHLVIHDRGSRHEALLCEWRSGEGPRQLEALLATPSAAPSAATDDRAVLARARA